MSREEAKTNLNMIRVAFGVPVTKEQKELVDETFEMAIQSLSQEPCTDAVSRAKAIENVVQIAKTFADSDKQKALCGRIIFMLEHMSEVSEMITEEYYKPCSLCHNADCVWMGGKDTHKLCEDFQALSQEPTDENLHREREQAYMQGYEDASKRFRQEPCDDAIDRDAVKELIKSGVSTDTYDDVEQVCKWIDALPSVTQKSGKWILSEDGLYRPLCDKCGAHPWKGYIPTVEEATEVFKYCPNCGAKMESEVSNG